MNREYNNLTLGEQQLIEWQYRRGNMGSFTSALWEAISHADEYNLASLKLGFPSQVVAYTNYTKVSGWWQELKERVGLEEL